MLAACSSSSADNAETEQDKKDHLILAVGGEPEDGFDPTTGWGRYGSPLFQSTLLKRDKEFTIQNDLATGYDVSENRLVWTVKIRDDVSFSDGEPLTAEDIAFTFETAATSSSVIDLTNLEKVEMVDPYTVKFFLKQPQSTFVHSLVSTGIVPKHVYNENYNENPIGSGPYMLEQWDKGQQLIVKANPEYYGEEPYFKKLTFLFLSEDAAFAAANAGEVDIAAISPAFANQDVPGMDLKALDSVDNRGVMFPTVPEGGKTEQGLPIGNDVTADLAIRKAINIGIDRQSLVDGVLAGYGTPAYTENDGLPWWNPETVIEGGNLERAGKILKDAGWQKSEKGILKKNGLEATFKLLYPAGDQIRQSLSITLADMMEPLGIIIKAEGKSWNEIERMQHSTPVMMGFGNYNPIESFNLFSSSTQGEGWLNAGFYSNPTVDKYMEQALAASSEAEAIQYWQKAQWDGETGYSVKGDAAWAWLVNLKHLYLVKEGLDIGEQKVHPHGHGWPITDVITQWHWEK
ncbi:ABC transporter substrate-binding protein [Halobacillus shinanisalinarum]|uniref:ABC transporter substrate-binding protein n=1 Tax=Halobacillus shinanisalinarum TaxID=2932258 RepID=A0ABY4H595_9BACI|nr:ABC transporter substrate-binding protein [Halobacillus shinanisalinarum]UOQ95637.1 ABC transporter substrate-binding protein [Halobacillus shinanisalinarum]